MEKVMPEGDEANRVCRQCGKPAFWDIQGAPYCIDCEYRFQLSQYMKFQQNAAMLNFAAEEMDAVVPIGPPSPRIKIPAAPIPPIHYNYQSVQVSGGTVGVVNFGMVAHDIAVNLQAVTEAGGVDAAEHLRQFTQLVLDDRAIDEQSRAELAQQIAVIAEQAKAPAAERKPGVIKAVLGGVKDTATCVASLAEAWKAAEPVVKAWFGLS
jgi:hypothetical protein